MKKINIFTIFLITIMIVVSFASPAVLALSSPKIEADAALLVETKSGKILYEQNKARRVAPGSIAKVMTLLLAVEAAEDEQTALKDNITASETFLNGIGEADTTLNIKTGEIMSYEDLIYCMYLVSANDACNILAETIGGNIPDFVDKMNEKAEALGCTDTYFTNAGGLTDAGQYTSSWDQYLIFEEAIGHPLFLQVAGTVSYTVKATNLSPERSLVNSNAMLSSSSEYYYEFCAAGKTASSSEYGYSFVSYASNSSLSLISVVFGAKQTGAEGASDNIDSFTETLHLFDWGFDSFVWQDIIKKNETAFTEKITLAERFDTIELKSSETITILARRDIRAEDVTKDVMIYGQTGGKELSAPVKSGDILGEMMVYIDGDFCGKVYLTAANNIDLDKASFIKDQIKKTLSKFWVQLIIVIFLILIGLYIWLVIRDFIKRREKKRKQEEARRKIIEGLQRRKITK